MWSNTYWDDGLAHVTTLPTTGTATYGFDALQRLTSIDYSGSATPDVAYEYDVDDNRTKMTDGIGTSAGLTYTYDNLNNLTQSDRHYSGSTQTFAYQYYAGSQAKKVTYPDGAINGYYYDDDNRLCSLKLGASRPGATVARPPATATTPRTTSPRRPSRTRTGT